MIGMNRSSMPPDQDPLVGQIIQVVSNGGLGNSQEPAQRIRGDGAVRGEQVDDFLLSFRDVHAQPVPIGY
jgi:hypothetical protein